MQRTNDPKGYLAIPDGPFKNLKALQHLLFRPRQSKRTETWRQRSAPEGNLCDAHAYGGRLFTEYNDFFSQSKKFWFHISPTHKRPFRKNNSGDNVIVATLPAVEHEPPEMNSFVNQFVKVMKD